jgi:hypothetical protein
MLWVCLFAHRLIDFVARARDAMPQTGFQIRNDSGSITFPNAGFLTDHFLDRIVADH